MKSNKADNPIIRTKVYSTSEGRINATSRRRRRYVQNKVESQAVNNPSSILKIE